MVFATLGPADRIQTGNPGLQLQRLIESGVRAIQPQSSVEGLMAEESPTKVVCVRIAGSESAVRALLSRRPMDIGSIKREGDKVVLEVFVPESVVAEIKGPIAAEMKGENLDVQELFDASARGQERQKEVGQGNRFTGERLVPSGLGT